MNVQITKEQLAIVVIGWGGERWKYFIIDSKSIIKRRVVDF
jgi:hypothetical protein